MWFNGKGNHLSRTLQRIRDNHLLFYHFPSESISAFTTLALPEKPPVASADPHSLLQSEHIFFLQQLNISPQQVAYVHQVHGNKIVAVEHGGDYGQADALMTATANVFLTIRTADCTAVFVAAPDVPAVGIAHAGWRGTRKHVAIKLLQTMMQKWRLNPQEIYVALSPALQVCCFQVTEEFLDFFPPQFFQKKNGNWHFHMQKALLHQIQSVGIPPEHILQSSECTACAGEAFYSHRANKTRHRHLNAIGIVTQPKEK